MSRCYSINVNHIDSDIVKERKTKKSIENQPISSCFHSPKILLRQKSFHTLNEFRKFCQIKKYFNTELHYNHNDNIKQAKERSTITTNTTSETTKNPCITLQLQCNTSKYDRKQNGNVGDICELDNTIHNNNRRMSYNPSEYSTFYDSELFELGKRIQTNQTEQKQQQHTQNITAFISLNNNNNNNNAYNCNAERTQCDNCNNDNLNVNNYPDICNSHFLKSKTHVSYSNNLRSTATTTTATATNYPICNLHLIGQIQRNNHNEVRELCNTLTCNCRYTKNMEYALMLKNVHKQQQTQQQQLQQKRQRQQTDQQLQNELTNCYMYEQYLQEKLIQQSRQQQQQQEYVNLQINANKLFTNATKSNMLVTTTSTTITTTTTTTIATTSGTLSASRKMVTVAATTTMTTNTYTLGSTKIKPANVNRTRSKNNNHNDNITTSHHNITKTNPIKFSNEEIIDSIAGDNHNFHNEDNENVNVNVDIRNASKSTMHKQLSHMRQYKNVGNTPHRTKMSKKQLKLAQIQLDKLTQCNVHLHALFSAVENGHLDKAHTVLESTDVNVNSVNIDGLSALDIAVLSNNRSMTKMLLQHGALESTQFAVDSLGTKLNNLLKEAESRIQDLNGFEGTCQTTYTTRSSISSIIIGNTNSSITGCTGNDIDKQIGIWERRIKGLRRLILGWDQTRPPDAPASVTVDVISETSVQVQILEPFDGAIGTKFQVQWSTRADFSNVLGERKLVECRSFHGTMGTQCKINNLTRGRRYFIRASCGNVKGWGDYKYSVPASIIPSSWRDLHNREDRFTDHQQILDHLFAAVRLARPADVSELTLESHMYNHQKKNPKKKTTIKQLFTVTSKFQKHLKSRGIHLASIIYCEDKVLVTSEEFLPVIEIDESYPVSSLYNDYHWLMKVACSWDDVKSLRSDMERNLTSANQFRIKLLTAICQMQSALGFNDLGQLYYKPLKDLHCGTVVITTIQNVKNQKSVSILNSRWLPINKLQKKVSALHEASDTSEMVVSSLKDQIKYSQAALQPLTPGLYLGYLKMQCSMDQIQVFVPLKTPNVLPHYKVRENYHINAEEWLILKHYSNNFNGSTIMDICHCSPLVNISDADHNSSNTVQEECSEPTTEVQRLFLYDLSQALQKLLHYMDVQSGESNSHRLYDLEVIEHSKDISFLIICPAVQLSCGVPGQSETLLQREDLAPLSVQSFEMIHLRTYHPAIMEKYARLSCILELDTTLANQSHREAFANSELKIAKERLAKLQELTNNLNTVWKSVRWLMDVIAFARDKNAPNTSTVKDILEFGQNCTETMQGNSQFLQPPLRDVQFHKTGSGRGSWPGPSSTATDEDISNHFKAEYSKSEQNLGLEQKKSPTISLESKQNTKSGEYLQTTVERTSSSVHINNNITEPQYCVRKKSAESVLSQYMPKGAHCSAIGAICKTTTFNTNTITTSIISHFNIPLSHSADTLAETKRQQKPLMQRKCTSSNIVTSCSTPITPVTSGIVSRSVPTLDMAMSNPNKDSTQSLKFEVSTESSKTKEVPNINAKYVKIKSVSTANLQECAGLSLKTSLTSLPSDVKTAIPITIGDGKATTSAIEHGLERQSSNIELSTISYSSLSSGDQVSTSPTSGVIQVYTAYNTGLASGTSLKLHVTAKTTSREIINLVVKQLNMATALKGSNGPIYSGDMLNNFCLVAVIGARERCLRDDFKPLLLQNPWRKGRLYVRQKHELLAAIEHASHKSQLI